MNIVPFTAQFIESAAALEARAGDACWTRGQFEKELGLPFSRLWVLEEGDDLLGYVGFWKVADEAQMTNLVICPERRRQGLGRLLLDHLLSEARREGCIRSTLEVRIGNTAARRLYQQMGFIEQGTRPRFYDRPVEDAVLMEKRF